MAPLLIGPRTQHAHAGLALHTRRPGLAARQRLHHRSETHPTMPPPVKRPPGVLVADADSQRRDSLRSMLADAGYEVNTFPTAAALLQAVDPLTTECLIVHVPMPDLDGLELPHKLLSLGAAPSIIVVTTTNKAFAVVPAEKLDRVFLLTDLVTPQILLACVLEAHAVFQRSVAAHIRHCHLARRVGKITKRQLELLRLIAQGDSTKEIALKLKLSERTVAHQRSHLLRKTKSKNTADLVFITTSLGII